MIYYSIMLFRCSLTFPSRKPQPHTTRVNAASSITYCGRDPHSVRAHSLTFVSQVLTVSFHNFKSQNFKLSVSNPKSKYVAYLPVLSQISNCQGLGRKNKHEILKTDRTHFCLTAASRDQQQRSSASTEPSMQYLR